MFTLKIVNKYYPYYIRNNNLHPYPIPTINNGIYLRNQNSLKFYDYKIEKKPFKNKFLNIFFVLNELIN